MKRLKIAVLFGGCSPEYSVSLQSAAAVLQNMDSSKYRGQILHAVDGFSLDAQKEKLKKYADYQDMVVVREFSDEGKSGKNVDGRPQFKEMLELIEAGTDEIELQNLKKKMQSLGKKLNIIKTEKPAVVKSIMNTFPIEKTGHKCLKLSKY